MAMRQIANAFKRHETIIAVELQGEEPLHTLPSNKRAQVFSGKFNPLSLQALHGDAPGRTTVVVQIALRAQIKIEP